MLALKTNCVHPETKKAYIKSSIGGKENSEEGRQVSEPSPERLLLFVMHFPTHGPLRK